MHGSLVMHNYIIFVIINCHSFHFVQTYAQTHVYSLVQSQCIIVIHGGLQPGTCVSFIILYTLHF